MLHVSDAILACGGIGEFVCKLLSRSGIFCFAGTVSVLGEVDGTLFSFRPLCLVHESREHEESFILRLHPLKCACHLIDL